MSALTWVALALAIVLVPLGDPGSERLRLLGRRGRLQLPGSHVRRMRRMLRPSVLSAPVVGSVALAVVTVRAGPILGLAAGLVGLTAVRLGTESARARAAERSTAGLLAGLRVLAAEVAAGAAPEAALRAAAEADPSRATPFGAAAAASAAGGDVAAALSVDAELARVGHAWVVTSRTGAPMAAVLERVVADVAARREQGRAVTAALAGPRSSAAVLAVLPVLGLALGIAMDADPLAFLVGTSAGQLVCLAGVVLDLAGLVWTRRLAAGAALP